MKALILKPVLAFLLLLFVHAAFAQVDYNYHETEDGVRIEYRWQRERFFARNSNAVLNLQLTNQGTEPVEVVFSAAFYEDGRLLFRSEDEVICLGPGESKRGLRAGLRFTAPGITMDMVQQDWFSWDMYTFEVKEVDQCED